MDAETIKLQVHNWCFVTSSQPSQSAIRTFGKSQCLNRTFGRIQKRKQFGEK